MTDEAPTAAEVRALIARLLAWDTALTREAAAALAAMQRDNAMQHEGLRQAVVKITSLEAALRQAVLCIQAADAMRDDLMWKDHERVCKFFDAARSAMYDAAPAAPGGKDAERWQRVRSERGCRIRVVTFEHGPAVVITEDDADAAIDAAIREQAKGD